MSDTKLYRYRWRAEKPLDLMLVRGRAPSRMSVDHEQWWCEGPTPKREGASYRLWALYRRIWHPRRGAIPA